ncbi:hypothetical protein Bca4012_037828 [Brassica carinata]|uniref:Uncharacterized protein n=1 Tax=Brassica carinata TaxID=52824 RepID=A0A8X7WFH8_BRACI|nr:hypothetical protein Bca52824_011459 [Brassica carinata]
MMNPLCFARSLVAAASSFQPERVLLPAYTNPVKSSALDFISFVVSRSELQVLAVADLGPCSVGIKSRRSSSSLTTISGCVKAPVRCNLHGVQLITKKYCLQALHPSSCSALSSSSQGSPSQSKKSSIEEDNGDF